MDKSYRNDWIELCCGKSSPSLMYSTSHYFDQRHMIHISVGFAQMFLSLPIYSKKEEDCDYPQYGLKYHDSCLWLHYGLDKWKCFHMPWDWTWVRTSYLKKDNTYISENLGKKNRIDSWDEKWKDIFWSEIYDYQYKLKSGEIQNIKAIIKVEEREWRWRWFTWLKFFGKIRRTIAVEFNEEVGEERGSWKGGCTGCNYTLKKGESPLECLRRMEKERKF